MREDMVDKENHGDQQGIFFAKYSSSQSSLENLCQSFRIYLPYFQESLWLLEQKFLANYAQRLNKGQEDLFQELLEKHKQDMLEGSQASLVELLVQSKFLSFLQSKEALEKMGKGFFICPSCNIHFQSALNLSGNPQKCTCCGNLLEERFEKSSLWNSFHGNFCSPRLVAFSDLETPLIFLDMEEHSTYSLLQIEEEIHLVLKSLEFWIDSIENSLPGMEKAVSPVYADKNSLAITKAMSKHLFLESSEKEKEGEKQNLHTFSVFSGYLENLYELFWYFCQKIFTEFAQKKGYLSAKQMAHAWKDQVNAFHEGQNLHIAEILQKKGLLEEEQIIEILSSMGYGLYYCQGCNLTFAGIFSQKKDLSCCVCQHDLAANNLESKWFNFLRSIFFNLPIPLGVEKEYSSFSFFKAKENYKPQFCLTQEEVQKAWESCQEKKTPEFDFILETHQEDSLILSEAFLGKEVLPPLPKPLPEKKSLPQPQEKEEVVDIFGIADLSQELKAISDKEEKSLKRETKEKKNIFEEDMLNVSQEVDMLMRSLEQAGKANDEAIYDRYAQAGEKDQAKDTENPVQPMKGVHVEKKYIQEIENQGEIIEKKSKKGAFHSIMPYESMSSPSMQIWPIVLIVFFLLSFFSLFFLGIWDKDTGNSIEKTQEQPKKNITKEEAKQTATNTKPEQKPDTEIAVEPVKQPVVENPVSLPEETPKIEKNIIETPLKKILGDSPDEDKISSSLISLVNSQQLTKDDIPSLQKIYQDYPDNSQLRSLCIWAAGYIKGEEAREWILKIANQSSSSVEKISAVEALEKFQDQKAKEDILEIFKNETHENVTIACVTALVKLGSQDEGIYQKLVNKFHETESQSLRSLILLVVANMKVSNISLFLGEILRNPGYSIDLRFQSLEALASHARGNHEKKNIIQILQNLVHSVNDDRIKDAIIASLEDLTSNE